MRCEGWTRHGGIFTFGPVTWVQCPNEAVVELEVEQQGQVTKQPACSDCWEKAKANSITIIAVAPLPKKSWPFQWGMEALEGAEG